MAAKVESYLSAGAVVQQQHPQKNTFPAALVSRCRVWRGEGGVEVVIKWKLNDNIQTDTFAAATPRAETNKK